jgi:hypothetical protein
MRLILFSRIQFVTAQGVMQLAHWCGVLRTAAAPLTPVDPPTWTTLYGS